MANPITKDELLQIIAQAQRTGQKTLDLRYTQLSQLPAKIGQLTHLESLYLNGTQLSQLPAEIGQLDNLSVIPAGEIWYNRS